MEDSRNSVDSTRNRSPKRRYEIFDDDVEEDDPRLVGWSEVIVKQSETPQEDHVKNYLLLHGKRPSEDASNKIRGKDMEAACDAAGISKAYAKCGLVFLVENGSSVSEATTAEDVVMHLLKVYPTLRDLKLAFKSSIPSETEKKCMSFAADLVGSMMKRFGYGAEKSDPDVEGKGEAVAEEDATQQIDDDFEEVVASDSEP